MPLAPEVVADMKLSFAALKKRRGLDYYLIPARVPLDPPWLLIDKSERIRPRFVRALNDAGRLGYTKGLAVGGRLAVVGGKVVLVVDEPVPGLRQKLRGPWAKGLREAGDEELSKLGVLLQRAEVMTEEEVALIPTKGGEDEDLDPSSGDLAAIFGDDPEAAEAALSRLDELNGHLEDLPKASEETREYARALFASLDRSSLATLGDSIGPFIKMAVTELPAAAAALHEGDEVDPRDRVLGLASTMNAYLRSRVAWEERQDQALSLQGELDRLGSELLKRALDAGEAEALRILTAQYNAARLAGERARDLADRLLSVLQDELTELQGRPKAGGRSRP